MAVASGVLRPRSWAETAVAAAGVAVAAACFATGQYLVALALAGAAILAVLTYYWPAPGVALVVFLSTEGLKFFSLEKLPFVQLGPGLRLNSGDVALLLVLGVGVAHLMRRKERPHFGVPLLAVGVAVAISLCVGLVSGTIDVGVGFNGLRVFSGYLFYVALVGVIDTPQKLRNLMRVMFTLVVASVVIQVIEATMGERITTPLSSTSEYFSATQYVSNIDGTVPYLWNRGVGYLLLGLFFALGGWLWSHKPAHAVVAALAMVGFVVALVRQWYIFIGIGVVLLLMVGSRQRNGAVMRTVLSLLLLLALVVSASAWLPASFPLADALQQRTGSILNFETDYSVVARIDVWHAQLETFLDSPIVGLGPGTAETLFTSGSTGWSTDIGMTNTLVQFGALGMAAFLFLIVSVYRTANDLVRRMPASSGREYAAAAFSAWVAIVVAYGFTQDFFTSTELAFATGFVMVVVDRLRAFSLAQAGAT